MTNNWNISEYVKNLEQNEIEDFLNVVGAKCVTWAGQNLEKGYVTDKKFRTGLLENTLCYSTSKTQIQPKNGKPLEQPERGVVRIGSNEVYAAMHEYGGRISATNAQALTIPISDEAKIAGMKGKTARDFPDLVLIHPKESNNVFLVKMTGKDTFIIMYMLVKSVEQPAHPYLRPVLENHKEDVLKLANMVNNK